MQQTRKIWCIIPAAGLGLRVGADVPKQYLFLHDKTVLEHTINIFIDHPQIEKVVVALHSKDQHWSGLHCASHKKLFTTIGGEQRAHSVLNALQTLKDFAASEDWVLIHDAARPCLRPHLLNDFIEQLQNHPVGGILAIPATDTLKRVNQNLEIIETVPRAEIWRAQTPQMFRYGLLTEAIRKALQENYVITDDASAIEYMGQKPLVISGDPKNIKITHATDISIAEKYLFEEQ